MQWTRTRGTERRADRGPRVLLVDVLDRQSKADPLRLLLYDVLLDDTEATVALVIGYLRLQTTDAPGGLSPVPSRAVARQLGVSGSIIYRRMHWNC